MREFRETLKGAFDPPGTGDPLAAIVDACRALCRDLEALPRARLQGWRERLGASMGATMPALVALLPEVAAVVGPLEPPPPLPLADAIHRDRLTLQRFLHTFADAEHPLVLFLDNLHAADEATFEFLRALLGDRASHHLLLITAYREASLGEEHPLHRLISALGRGASPPLAITLGPLGEVAIRELVATSLPGLASGPMIDDLVEVLLLHTRGNPRFVHELLGSLIREGRLGLDPRRGALVITPAAGETLPESVVDLVARQLQRLPQATLSLVGDAALLGYRFSLQALAAVTKERELQELRGRLEPALAGGLLVAITDEPLRRQPFLLGDRFSAADLLVGSLLDWADACGLLDGREPQAGYLTRLRQRPAYQRAIA